MSAYPFILLLKLGPLVENNGVVHTFPMSVRKAQNVCGILIVWERGEIPEYLLLQFIGK